MKFILSVILCLSCVLPAAAQAPYLVKDINPGATSAPASSLAREFATIGSWTYFAATTSLYGREVFKTDGIEIELVKDLRSGPDDSWPRIFGKFPDDRFIVHAEGAVTGELWVSNGTDAGTHVIKTLPPSSWTTSMGSAAGKVFFITTESDEYTLWATDGTSDGTVPLMKMPLVYPKLASFNGLLYFTVSGNLWRSDGTIAGTYIVKSGINAVAIRQTRNGLLLSATDPDHGHELWLSDGSADHTSLLLDLRAGTGSSLDSSQSANFGFLNGRAVFAANDGTRGSGLWICDGTVAGTIFLHTLTTSVRSIGIVGNDYYYLDGDALWRTDGTPAGTLLVKQSIPNFWTSVTGDRLYFTTRDTYKKTESVWSSDGTDAGTSILMAASYQTPLHYGNGKLYFSINDPTIGIEPVVSDGTYSGTHVLANMLRETGASSDPKLLGASATTAFLTAVDTSGAAPRLWVSNGNPSGTFAVPQPTGTDPFRNFEPIGVVNGRLFVISDSSLWVADGNGITKLFDRWCYARAMSRYVYVSVSAYGAGGDLYRTDGTPEGTVRLAGNLDANLAIAEYEGVVFFNTRDGLYRTEGTPETTRKVSSVPAAGLGLAVGNHITDGGSVFDPATGISETYLTFASAAARISARGLFFFISSSGHVLWRSDGTAAGTYALTPEDYDAPYPEQLVVLNDVVYFAGYDDEHGTELWRTDGTKAGTYRAVDIEPGAGSSDPASFVTAHGRLWFAASVPGLGRELVSSDGTPEGTSVAADIDPNGSSSPVGLTRSGSLLYFSASDSLGRELWALPLPANTTYAIEDVHVDESSTVAHFRVVRGGDTARAATFRWQTEARTADTSDFVAAGGELAFQPGQSEQLVDVQLTRDDIAEPEESFAVIIAPLGGETVERSVGLCFISGNDHAVNLEVSFSVAPPGITVRNKGDFTAHSVVLSYSQSPAPAEDQPANADTATTVNLGSIVPGGAVFTRLTIARGWGSIDPIHPPGETVWARVSAAEPFLPASVTRAAAMFSSDLRAMGPAWLTEGGQGRLDFRYDGNLPATISLSTATGLIGTAPPSVSLGTNAVATFTLGAGYRNGWETVRVTSPLDTDRPLFTVAIAPPGVAPRLDVMLQAATLPGIYWGSDVEFDVSVLGNTEGGLHPGGSVRVLGTGGAVVATSTLDAKGACHIVVPKPEPGTYRYIVVFDGDTNFNPLSVASDVNVYTHSTYLEVFRGISNCSGDPTVPVRVQVRTYLQVTPTGVIRVTGATTALQLTLRELARGTAIAEFRAPSGEPLTVEYLPSTGFVPQRLSVASRVTACAIGGMNATPTGGGIDVRWVGNGSAVYNVYRFEAGVEWNKFIGQTAGTSFLDTTATAGRIFLYRVVGANGGSSRYDVASTYQWTDDPVVAGVTAVKAAHVTELSNALYRLRLTVDWLLDREGLITSTAGGAAISATSPTGPKAVAGAFVLASEISALRAAIADALSLGGMPYTFAAGPAQGAIIRANDINQLRNAMK